MTTIGRDERRTTNVRHDDLIADQAVRNVVPFALAYAKLGWPVFPVRRDKVPFANCDGCRRGQCAGPARCGHLSCHSFHGASCDEREVLRRFGEVGACSLAIRTGHVSGLVVIDIDLPEVTSAVLSSLPVHDLLPPTLTVLTGRGRHLYYRHPGGLVPCSSARLAHGVDVRADGGYVVAPPSVHLVSGRAYEFVDPAVSPVEMPAELIGLLVTARAPRPTCSRPARPSAGTRDQALVQAVLHAPVGKRNSLLFWAACRAVSGDRSDRSLTVLIGSLALAAQEAGLGEAEIRRTIASAVGRSGRKP